MPPQEKWTSGGFSATATRKWRLIYIVRCCVCVCQSSILTSVLQLADGHSHAGVGEGEREAPGDAPVPAGAGGPGFWDHSSGYRDKGHVKVWPEGPESLIPAAAGNQTSARAALAWWTLDIVPLKIR